MKPSLAAQHHVNTAPQLQTLPLVASYHAASALPEAMCSNARRRLCFQLVPAEQMPSHLNRWRVVPDPCPLLDSVHCCRQVPLQLCPGSLPEHLLRHLVTQLHSVLVSLQPLKETLVSLHIMTLTKQKTGMAWHCIAWHCIALKKLSAILTLLYLPKEVELVLQRLLQVNFQNRYN